MMRKVKVRIVTSDVGEKANSRPAVTAYISDVAVRKAQESLKNKKLRRKNNEDQHDITIESTDNDGADNVQYAKDIVEYSHNSVHSLLMDNDSRLYEIFGFLASLSKKSGDPLTSQLLIEGALIDAINKIGIPAARSFDVHKGQAASEFLRENYAEPLRLRILYQNVLRKIDPKLMEALDNEFKGRREELRALLPSKQDEVALRSGNIKSGQAHANRSSPNARRPGPPLPR